VSRGPVDPSGSTTLDASPGVRQPTLNKTARCRTLRLQGYDSYDPLHVPAQESAILWESSNSCVSAASPDQDSHYLVERSNVERWHRVSVLQAVPALIGGD
jgi:hypothetical protein